MKRFIKQLIFVYNVLLLTTCSPRISEMSLSTRFQRKDYRTKEFVKDSTTSFCIWVNTYKGLFTGRESFFYFIQHRYFFVFDKIDTLYRETDIKYFKINNGK